MKGLEGILKCDLHDESFNVPSEFYEHCNTKPHTDTGKTLCLDCNASGIKEKAEVDPTDLHLGRPTGRCEDCNDKLEKKVEAKIKARGKDK